MRNKLILLISALQLLAPLSCSKDSSAAPPVTEGKQQRMCDDSLNNWFIDLDGDGYFVKLKSPISLCDAEEKGLDKSQVSQLSNRMDCDDENAEAFKLYNYKAVDADGDGVFAPQEGHHCGNHSLPLNLSLFAPPSESIDCDDTSADRFQTLNLGLDQDGDGVFQQVKLNQCIGNNLEDHWQIINGYIDDTLIDCDDSNPETYQKILALGVDEDGDGYAGRRISEMICSGAKLPSIYLKSVSELDCNDNDRNLFKMLSYSYEDKDRDGVYVSQQGSLCSGMYLDSQYSKNPSLKDDCDDNDAEVFQMKLLGEDIDQDGHFINRREMCVGREPPQGLIFTVMQGEDDCDDNAKEKYQLLKYRGIDKDGDGFAGTPKTGKVCAGKNLPYPYTAQFKQDCDDNKKQIYFLKTLFPDEDGDGHGIKQGAQEVCIGSDPATIPLGMSESSQDCAPQDPLKFKMHVYDAIDSDGDSHYRVLASEEKICLGESANPRYVVKKDLSGHIGDCDDNDDKVFYTLAVYQDTDGDGYGTGIAQYQCRDFEKMPRGLSLQGGDQDDSDNTIQDKKIDFTIF